VRGTEEDILHLSWFKRFVFQTISVAPSGRFYHPRINGFKFFRPKREPATNVNSGVGRNPCDSCPATIYDGTRQVTLMSEASGATSRMAGGHLTSPFLELLPVTGVAITVFDQNRRASLVHATDGTSTRLEEIQFDLGEGPSFDAYTAAALVTVPDLAQTDRWPAFLSGSAELGVGAIFAFPLMLGAACTGTVTCYRSSPGGLDEQAAEIGTSLCRAIAGPTFRRAILLAGHEPPDDAAPLESRREIHQATGMVLTQLNISATDALSRLRAYAFSSGSTVQEIAHDVVGRRLNFADFPE
jgi:hypothetical protein